MQLQFSKEFKRNQKFKILNKISQASRFFRRFQPLYPPRIEPTSTSVQASHHNHSPRSITIATLQSSTPERCADTISDSWLQGRTTFGGLSAALCLEGARRLLTPEVAEKQPCAALFILPDSTEEKGFCKFRLLFKLVSVIFLMLVLSMPKF